MLKLAVAMGCQQTKVRRSKKNDTPVIKDGITFDSFLSDEEKSIVRKTWSNHFEKDMVGFGVIVFERIFEAKPEVKSLFPFGDQSGESLRKNHLFRAHGLRFMKAVGACVDSLDDTESTLTPMLLRLGETHARIDGFSCCYFDAYKATMTNVWGNQLGKIWEDEDVRFSWTKVFDFMMQRLADGYQNKLNDQQRSKDVQNSENDNDSKTHTNNIDKENKCEIITNNKEGGKEEE
ncbi:unnamed protein product [Dimorphilus gyrociliatus]|uniref:Globin domain-containing protein n=1 Tax=Dimorphilus gyrociliatus TaxID=2664684 RepID=A0A7I8VF55_9ANNE|nr:unnamed protein product [Dimorphilus gyrociliatus]